MSSPKLTETERARYVTPPVVARWRREAYAEIAARDLREGDRVLHAHTDRAGTVLGLSLIHAGYVLVDWDGPDATIEEPWDLDVQVGNPEAARFREAKLERLVEDDDERILERRERPR